MKRLITTIALSLSVVTTFAQTTATDWTAPDCDGVSHTLFSELDSGKVIVFAWVMPCSSCKAPSKTAYDAVQSFATTHPGKVRFYMADDFGNTSCAGLSNWVTLSAIGSVANMKIFSNAGLPIDENDFGGTGMPHIVVMGGPGHTIHFNKKNSASNDLAGITAAINTAIGTTGVKATETTKQFAVSPNPATTSFIVSYPGKVASVEVLEPSGRLAKTVKYSGGVTNPEVDCSQLPTGVYVIRLTDMDGAIFTQKFARQ